MSFLKTANTSTQGQISPIKRWPATSQELSFQPQFEEREATNMQEPISKYKTGRVIIAFQQCIRV
jgi:hypothetical protein